MEHIEKLKKNIRVPKYIKENKNFGTFCKFLYSFLYRNGWLDAYLRGLDYPNRTCEKRGNVAGIISTSMVWSDTDDGYDFWENIHDRWKYHHYTLMEKDKMYKDIVEDLWKD